MITLFLLLVPPLVGLIAIIAIAIWGTNLLAYWTVGRKHQLMQEILETGDVPQTWRKKFAPRLSRLRAGTANEQRSYRLQRQAQASYTQQLDRLIDYAATTPLVADEESRQELLSQLLSVRSTWSKWDVDPHEYHPTPPAESVHAPS